MKIDREQWVRLSALLDEALEIDATEREAWLQGLGEDAAPLTGRLRDLLAHQARVDTADFLKPPDFLAALRRETDRQAAAPELRPGALAGGYRLLRELGMGGMGSVWLAERVDGPLRRQVALKFPYAGPQQRQLAERLGRERDILARLEHPNIARLYDAQVTALGQPFLVLEYVDGQPIDAHCDQQRLGIRERLVLFLQVLAALQYAHAHLVIHRDLKPSNILVNREGVVRLLDFGIAKLMADGEAKETALTHLAGRALTPDYASPEQIAGQAITTASDVYSLGVVLYELLAGTRPYRLRRERRASLEEAIAQADITAPSRAAVSDGVAALRAVSARRLAHELRGDLDAILHKALQKHPAQRYASADALGQDIKHWLDGEMVEARPPGAWYRARKVVGRNRLLFGALAAVGLSLAVGAGLALWQARAATLQAERLLATKSFLVDIFNANSTEQDDPLKAQQTTARELLDRAAERVTADEHASPATADEVLDVLGGLYQDLGLDQKSADLRRRRVALLTRRYGADDVRTAQGQIDYARSLYGTDDWKQALPPLQEAERILDRRHDAVSHTRLLQLAAMAEYYRGEDRTRARQYSDRAIRLARTAHPTSAEFIEVLRGGALLDSETGNAPAAASLLGEALQVQQSSGAPDIRLIRPLVELAELQALDNATIAIAETNFRRGLDISRRLNGTQHIDTVQASLRYGKFLRGRERLTESAALLQEAERSAVTLLGEDETFHVPTVRDQLAQTEQALGEYAAAAGHYRRALAAREAKRSGNRAHAGMLADYASLLTETGHAEQSLALLTRATEYYEHAEVPVGNTDVPVFLSAAYSELARPRDALAVLDRYAPGLESLSPSMQIERALRRAAVQDALGDLPAAESTLTRQLARLGQQPRPDEKRLLEAQAELQLGLVRLRQARPGDARELLQRALESREARLPENSPLRAEAQVALASCLRAQGETAASRALLRRAQTVLAANPELGPRYRAPAADLARQLATDPPGRSVR